MVRPVPTSSTSPPLCASSRDRRLGRVAPRIADETLAGVREDPQRLGLLVADRQHQRARLRALRPSSNSICQPPPSRRAPTAVACSTSCVWPLATACVEDFAEIAAEQAPLGETAAIAALGLETRGEMVGIVGPGAHPFGADVEQMRRLVGRISNAAADAAAAVDQHRADTAARELGGEDRPRKAASDNRDRAGARSDFIIGPVVRVGRAGLALWIWS